MATQQENSILHGRIFPALMRFTLPLMLSVLIQGLYGAVDLIVVGQFGNTASVSAVANGSQIMVAVTGIIVGLSMGVSVLVGNRVGAKDLKGAADCVGAMVKLFSFVSLVLTVLLLVFPKQISQLMQVPGEAIDGTATYLRVCGAGIIFIVGFNAISGLFRGDGNSKSPLLFITIACVVNIVFDLLLCGVFHMDVFGAAIATVFAQAVSVVFSLYKIKNGGLSFKISRENFKNSAETVKGILKLGFPIAVQDFLVSVSFLIIMAIINGISLVASASVGIAEKLFLFLAIVPMSFLSSLSAFVAQNVGARQEKRAMKAVGIAMIAALASGVCMTLLTFFAGDVLAGIFEKNPEVIASTAEYLKGISFEYTILPVVFCLIGYFNGTGNTTFSMLEGVLTAFLVRIPLSYYFSRLPGTDLFTIGLAVPISAFASLLVCVVFYFVVKKRRLALPNQVQ